MFHGVWKECEICGMQIKADDTCYLEVKDETIVKMICMDCGSHMYVDCIQTLND